MLHPPFKIAPWARYEPAPLAIEDLRQDDILVAPTGSLWRVGLHRAFRGHQMVSSANGANRYIRNGTMGDWQIVVNNHNGSPLDDRL